MQVVGEPTLTNPNLSDKQEQTHPSLADPEKQAAAAAASGNTTTIDPIHLQPWTKDWIWELRGSTFMIVLTITLAVFTDVFTYSIVVPVVPYAFVERMGVSTDSVQSQVTLALAVYSAGLVVGSTVFGLVTDRLKQRQALMVGGLTIVLAATLVLCLTKTVWLYMVGRVLQGLSAAVVWTVGMAIIADTSEPENLAYLMSFPGIGSALGTFFGPFIGGIVYENAGYYAVFFVCFGVIVFDIVLRLAMLEKGELSKYRHKRALELSEMDPSSLEPELVKYMNRYINQPVSTDALYKAKQLEMRELYGDHFTLFGRRYNVPTMISILKYPRIDNAILLGIAQAWIPACLDTVLPLRMSELFGYNSQQSGLVFLALAVPSVTSPLFGKLVDRYGPRYVVTGGYLLMIAPLICLRIPDTDTLSNRVLFIALIALIGLCAAAITAPSMAEMSKTIAGIEEKYPGIYGKSKGFGQACALFNIGYSVGTLGAPFHAGDTKAKAGWNVMALSIAMFCLGVAVVSFFFTGGALIKGKHGKGEDGGEQGNETETGNNVVEV